MALKRDGRKLEKELEDYYVSGETILKGIFAFVVAALLVAGGVYTFIKMRTLTPEKVQTLIQEVEVGIADARKVSGDSAELNLATARITEAKAFLRAGQLEKARDSALDAQKLLPKKIEGGDGTPRRFDGTITAVAGKVEIQRANRTSWESAKQDMKLVEGDFLKTGPSGAAEVLAIDGTFFRIKANTLFEMHRANTGYQGGGEKGARRSGGKVVVGIIDTSTAEGSQSYIKTDAVTAEVGQRSDVAVSVDDARSTETSVYRGGATLRVEGGSSAALAEREAATVARGAKDIGPRRRIPDAPQLLSPEDNFAIDLRKGGQVTLKWKKTDAQRYRLQVARSRLFVDDSLSVDLSDRTKTEATLKVTEEGLFFWRVMALGTTAATNSEWSKYARFRVQATGIAAPTGEPPTLTLKRPTVYGTVVMLEGKTSPGANVLVNGENADVDISGNFKKTLTVNVEGAQEIVIQAIDGQGRKTERREPVVIQF